MSTICCPHVGTDQTVLADQKTSRVNIAGPHAHRTWRRMAKRGATPNQLFRAARERYFSSREALAEAANVELAPAFAMDANDIGKIERGIITYPREPRRAALRKALRTDSDAAIGLRSSGAATTDR